MCSKTASWHNRLSKQPCQDTGLSSADSSLWFASASVSFYLELIGNCHVMHCPISSEGWAATSLQNSSCVWTAAEFRADSELLFPPGYAYYIGLPQIMGLLSSQEELSGVHWLTVRLSDVTVSRNCGIFQLPVQKQVHFLLRWNMWAEGSSHWSFLAGWHRSRKTDSPSTIEVDRTSHCLYLPPTVWILTASVLWMTQSVYFWWKHSPSSESCNLL